MSDSNLLALMGDAWRNARHWRFVQFLVIVAVLSNGQPCAEAGDLATQIHSAPARQSDSEATQKSVGCVSCHLDTDQTNMHGNPAVILGCTDCHGGDPSIVNDATPNEPRYLAAKESAHVAPRLGDLWNYPHASANPERSFAAINGEDPAFIRFVNPSDYRVARESCGACHAQQIEAATRSLMATTAMLWGGGAYNNGLLPFKRYVLGEAYTRDGQAAVLSSAAHADDNMQRKGVLDTLYPLPTWQSSRPADNFRSFEPGGISKGHLFPHTALPNISGVLQTLNEPGRPDVRQSNRGPGTGLRVASPVLNIHKTRLNDPTTWFLGTNDNPGDYRHSGCAACHVVYANDRDPRHAGPYAAHGHRGKSITRDPTISHTESGHPLRHTFTNAIPTSQCMVCHMHQPNMFVNSFLGYTMWDYESDAPSMWPREQRYESRRDLKPGQSVEDERILGAERVRAVLDRNPEGAVPRGLWADPEFLAQVSEGNVSRRATQLADYHGHGWNFRAIYKRSRDGSLLDASGSTVADDDPRKFDKAVHLSSLHLDVGMHCVDCHFSQDAHGTGHLVGEVAQAVEIECQDCHGTASAYPTLTTSGPAARPGGADLALLRTPDGRRRFEWRGDALYQRSSLWPDREWQLSLVKDSVNPGHDEYNPRSARAKTMSSDHSMRWGPGIEPANYAHQDDEMTCFSCHSAWMTSCGGCHLPSEANWKTASHHYDDRETRGYATYNPQVVRDQMFQLGRHGPAKGARIAPVRSSSALIASSTNANHDKVTVQQAPISASGFSAQAFAPHFPHTVRKTETKTCTDCHVSEKNDNNAIMAQLLLQGTQFVNFIGYHAWLGTESAVNALQVTEWKEPQAVIGSYLHRYAYPDWWQRHSDRDRVLEAVQRRKARAPIACLQVRGEYLYTAQGPRGLQVYDIHAIANKSYSQRISAGPYSALGQNTRVDSADAACVILPTTQPIHPNRRAEPDFGLSGEAMAKLMSEVNQEQAFHPIYNYALIVDRVEGLIMVDINTLADGNPRNNKLERALTWNEHNVLDGARHISLGGHYAYITTPDSLVVLNLDDPLQPKLVTGLSFEDPRASAVQFRYLFVTDAKGLNVVDITLPDVPRTIPAATLALTHPERLFLARTYAYVANGVDGLAIVDITEPERPRLHQSFTADGKLDDVRDVVVGSTNASLFAYIANGSSGFSVVQLTSPSSQPKFYGYSPEPRPELIASYPTKSPALSLSKGLERDRAVDESGHQIAVFGRIGSRPFNLDEMHELYLNAEQGTVWQVDDDIDTQKFVPQRKMERDEFAKPGAEQRRRPGLD